MFVDCQGKPVQLMSSPKPSPASYQDHLDPDLFDSLIATSQYDPEQTPANHPGQYVSVDREKLGPVS